MKLTANPIPHRIVEAGEGQTIILPGTASLDAACFKGNLAGVSLAWTLESGSAPVQFAAPDSEDTEATFTAPGSYVLKLTATAPGKTATDDSDHGRDGGEATRR